MLKSSKNYYEILGVTPDIEDTELKSVYRRLVRKTKKYIPLFTACTLVNGFAMFLIFSSVGVLLQTIFSHVTGEGDIVDVGEVGLYLLAICIFAFAGAFATTGFTYIEEKSRILIRTEMMKR